MNGKVIKASVSSVVLGAALMGCTTAGTSRSVASASQSEPNYRQAANAQEKAARMIATGDLAGAIAAMERAVAFSPQDAGYRKTLAELYLKTGRFASAETAYGDVVKLNPGDAKANFFLVVSQMALGRIDEALVQLGAMEANIDAADLGLAYALAGQTTRAIALLEPAAREATSTARLRQNLALAYALAGNWKNARRVAEQDLAPSVLTARLQEWAGLASSSDPQVRVATLLRVSAAASDPGQPQQLALVPAVAPTAAATAEQSAEVEPVNASVAAVDGPVAIAAAPAPVVADAPVEISAQPQVAVVAQQPASAPSVTPTAARVRPVRPAALPVARTQIRPGAASRLVVQVGAFRAPAQVERAWETLNRRFAFIARYQPLSTSVTLDGKGVFHRLSISGFESDSAAVNACRTIKSQGGSCFVRAMAGDAPVQWASRSARKA